MKNLKNLGKALTKAEQQTINGGGPRECCEWGPGLVYYPGDLNTNGGTYMGTVCIEWEGRNGCPFTAAY